MNDADDKKLKKVNKALAKLSKALYGDGYVMIDSFAIDDVRKFWTVINGEEYGTTIDVTVGFKVAKKDGND